MGKTCARGAFAVLLLSSCGHGSGQSAVRGEGLTVRIETQAARQRGVKGSRPQAPDRREADRDREPRRAARALSGQEREGVEWILAHQLPSGGWGQGDEAAQMGGGAELRAVGNVADTCMATLALVRAGSTPRSGPHRDAVRRAVDFVLASVDASDDDSLAVTDVQGTRVQAKIGRHVDTFASLLLMTEVKGEMGSGEADRRLERAIDKVVRKIERNQNPDGTWANEGWAPVLSQGIAALGLNRAAQGGRPVPPEVLARVEEQARGQFDARSGGFAAAPGSAGVEVYAGAQSYSSLGESARTHRNRRDALEIRARRGDDSARREIERGRRVERDADDVEEGLIGRLADPGFVQGFGSNGGEEFLSYMLISETLAARGGERWNEWNGRVKGLLAGVQNEDGSWTGHHCITGRTFCTSAALMVLLADQARHGASVRDLRG